MYRFILAIISTIYNQLFLNYANYKLMFHIHWKRDLRFIKYFEDIFWVVPKEHQFFYLIIMDRHTKNASSYSDISMKMFFKKPINYLYWSNQYGQLISWYSKTAFICYEISELIKKQTIEKKVNLRNEVYFKY